MWESRDPMFKFWDPLISREKLKLKTSNLARRRMAGSSNKKNAKLGQKGICESHVTQFWNFGTPVIPRERLKPETSNFARRWRAVISNEKNAKLGQKRSGRGFMLPNFGILGTPYISRTVEARNFKFGTETDFGEL